MYISVISIFSVAHLWLIYTSMYYCSFRKSRLVECFRPYILSVSVGLCWVCALFQFMFLSSLVFLVLRCHVILSINDFFGAAECTFSIFKILILMLFHTFISISLTNFKLYFSYFAFYCISLYSLFLLLTSVFVNMSQYNPYRRTYVLDPNLFTTD